MNIFFQWASSILLECCVIYCTVYYLGIQYPLFIPSEYTCYLAVNKVGEVFLFEKVTMCYFKSVLIVPKLLL